ncbi:putative ArCR [anaerobic digester metagenome]
MDTALRDAYTRLHGRYFPGAELPIAFEVGGSTDRVEEAPAPKGWRCFVCDLVKVRNGKSLAFSEDSIGCRGGRFYLGYDAERFPDFRYFLSCGKPGEMEGERYKQTPEIVDELDRGTARIPTKGKSIVFKRWDNLTDADNPDAVVFFARPEVLSGLFTLANFDQSDPNGVICPFGAGCSSVFYFPWLEQQSENPKAVLGMFDPSARPCVPLDVLTMAFPMKKFTKVVGFMEESFLITGSWEKVMKKIERSDRLYSPKK